MVSALQRVCIFVALIVACNSQKIIQQIRTQDQQKSDIFDLGQYVPNIDISIPDINIDFQSIKQKLPDVPDININIPNPDININIEDLKQKFFLVLDWLLKALIYVGIGLIVGALLPVLLFLCLCALGFTVGGVAAGSMAACCQPPNVAARSCFAILQSVGATARMLVITPYSAVLGGIAGLIFYICSLIFSLQINIDFQQIGQNAIIFKDTALGALTDLGIGSALGALAPIGVFLCVVGLQLAISSINLCFQSPTSIINIIQMIRKLRKCIILVPNTAIVGGMGGLAYFAILQ